MEAESAPCLGIGQDRQIRQRTNCVRRRRVASGRQKKLYAQPSPFPPFRKALTAGPAIIECEDELRGNSRNLRKAKFRTSLGDIADDAGQRGRSAIETDPAALQRSVTNGFPSLFHPVAISLPLTLFLVLGKYGDSIVAQRPPRSHCSRCLRRPRHAVQPLRLPCVLCAEPVARSRPSNPEWLRP